jgi:hypothetical protein
MRRGRCRIELTTRLLGVISEFRISLTEISGEKGWMELLEPY